MVSFDFPAGLVDNLTIFLASSFFTEHINSPAFKCLGCGIRLENEFGQRYFPQPYHIEIRYCQMAKGDNSFDEENLHVLVMSNQGQYEGDFTKLENCCVDCCKKIIGISLDKAVVSLLVVTN